MIVDSHRAVVAADPDDVFAVITEIAGRGHGIEPVVAVVAVDHRGRLFSYESRTEDADPSRARWTWTVRPAPGTTAGALVIVDWHIDVRSSLRRFLWPVRAWRLRTREVPRSIDALAAEVARRAATRPPSHRRLHLQAG